MPRMTQPSLTCCGHPASSHDLEGHCHQPIDSGGYATECDCTEGLSSELHLQPCRDCRTTGCDTCNGFGWITLEHEDPTGCASEARQGRSWT